MTRGALTLVFDDGYQHILENIVPLLDKYGIPAVFAVPLDHSLVSKAENMLVASVESWLPVKQTGHELAAHSVTHRNLTQLNNEDLKHELHTPTDILKASTLVYPGGAHDDRVVSFVRRHYAAARTVEPGYNSLPPKNPFHLKTFNYTKANFSPVKAGARATVACLTNKWLIETYHIVTDKKTEKVHAISLSDFARHLSFIRKLPINIATINTLISKLK